MWFLRYGKVLVLLLISTACLEVEDIQPDPADAGSSVTITGFGFGDGEAAGDAVFWGTTAVDILSWNDGVIEVELPISLPGGSHEVTVRSHDSSSPPFSHSVTARIEIENVSFTENPANHLSGTLHFETSAAIDAKAIRVSVTGAAGPSVVPESGVHSDGTRHSIWILGLAQQVEHTFTIEVTSGSSVTRDDSLRYTPSSNADHFTPPPIEVRHAEPAEMSPGYTLFGYTETSHPIPWSLAGRLVAVDPQGEIRWHHAIGDGVAMHVDHLASGEIMFLRAPPLSGDGEIVIIDPMGIEQSVWSHPEPGGYHHIATEMPNGNILALGSEMREISGYREEEVGCSTCFVVADRVQELDRETGAVVHTISLFDFLDPLRWNDAAFEHPFWDSVYDEDTRDLTHGNGVQYDPSDDSVILSLRTQSMLVKIKRDPLEWVWAIGTDDPDFAGDDDYPWLTPVGGATPPDSQHNVFLRDNGRIVFFDNRNIQNHLGSRTVEYEIDLRAGTYAQTWSWQDPDYDPPLYTFFTGDADPLPGGTVLVGDTGMGQIPVLVFLSFRWMRFAEVREADQHKVWEIWIEDPDRDRSYTGFDMDRIPDLYPPIS